MELKGLMVFIIISSCLIVAGNARARLQVIYTRSYAVEEVKDNYL